MPDSRDITDPDRARAWSCQSLYEVSARIRAKKGKATGGELNALVAAIRTLAEITGCKAPERHEDVTTARPIIQIRVLGIDPDDDSDEPK
jgi:hypothetical protein